MRSSASDPHKIRLQVFLSRNGVCSRREAMPLIQSGHVKLNGKVNIEPSTPVDPDNDRIEVDGKLVNIKEFLYIMLHKPAGTVTTKKDTHDRETVFDLLPKNMIHLNSVGRLDKETEGLLLFSNDGDLVHRLSHPSFEVDKIYEVIIDGTLRPEELRTFEEGMMIDGKKTAPAEIRRSTPKGNNTELQVLIHEGRKRQLRIMFAQLGYKVVYLKRIAQGPLQLGELKRGKWRTLSSDEIKALKER